VADPKTTLKPQKTFKSLLQAKTGSKLWDLEFWPQKYFKLAKN
jgi:hypothetical protein